MRLVKHQGKQECKLNLNNWYRLIVTWHTSCCAVGREALFSSCFMFVLVLLQVNDHSHHLDIVKLLDSVVWVVFVSFGAFRCEFSPFSWQTKIDSVLPACLCLWVKQISAQFLRLQWMTGSFSATDATEMRLNETGEFKEDVACAVGRLL